MGSYERHVLSRLTHLTMGNRRLCPYRGRVVSAARGTVLEIGIGSGHNLPFYSSSVEKVVGLDPSLKLLELARKSSGNQCVPIELLEGSAESIPLDDESVDTVVMTWTLCSIPDAGKALAETRRVLKRGGQMLFVEHGLAPEQKVRRWQHRLEPLWWRVSCHLNRPMSRLIEKAGFRIDKLDTRYLEKGPKTMTFLYEGVATNPQ